MRAALLAAVLGAALDAASANARAEQASGYDLLWVCEHYGCDSEVRLLTQALIRDQTAGVPYTAGLDPVCFPPEVTWPKVVAVCGGVCALIQKRCARTCTGSS